MTNIRLSPSGPIIGAIGAHGSIVQSNIATSIVTTGVIINTIREIKEDMSAVDDPTMRATLSGVDPANRLRVESDFDVMVQDSWTTGPITVTLDLSHDGGTNWISVHSTTQSWPTTTTTPDISCTVRGHIHVATQDVDLVAFDPTYVGGSLLARTTIVTNDADGFMSVVSETLDGSASITLWEVTP